MVTLELRSLKGFANTQQIALDTFVENVAALGVEKCLLHDLPDLISPTRVPSMADKKVSELGAEPAESREERAKAMAQAKALEEVIRTCRMYATYGTVDRLGA